MFGPLMQAVKCLQAESVRGLYDHCTGTVKKNRSMSTAVISGAIFTWPWLWLGRVVNIAAELFLCRSRDLGGVKIADGLLLCR